jgi:glycosyltransferase involved in cell wall biosynthesis
VGARFPVGDDAALARAIEALLSDEYRRRRCGKAGIENARRFEWTKIAEELDSVYERIGRP